MENNKTSVNFKTAEFTAIMAKLKIKQGKSKYAPILQTVRFFGTSAFDCSTAENPPPRSYIWAQSTDLESSVTIKLNPGKGIYGTYGGGGKAEFDFCVPFAWLENACRTLKAKKISDFSFIYREITAKNPDGVGLEVVKKEVSIIDAADGDFSVVCHSFIYGGADFPAVPTIAGYNPIVPAEPNKCQAGAPSPRPEINCPLVKATFMADHLIAALEAVIRSASKEDDKHFLSGMLFSSGVDGSKFVASDARRLSVYEMSGLNIAPKLAIVYDEKSKKWVEPNNDNGIAATKRERIVPMGALKKLMSIAGNKKLFPSGPASAMVEIFTHSTSDACTESHIFFSVGKDIEIVTRVIEGNFPRYQQIIPKMPLAVSFLVDISAIESVYGLFAKEKGRVLRLELNTEKTAYQIMDGKDHAIYGSMPIDRSEVEGDYDLLPSPLIINLEVVLDAAKGLGAKTLVFGVGSNATPVLVTSDKDANYTGVIMPMRIQ